MSLGLASKAGLLSLRRAAARGGQQEKAGLERRSGRVAAESCHFCWAEVLLGQGTSKKLAQEALREAGSKKSPRLAPLGSSSASR